jgi:hypothetical protein
MHTSPLRRCTSPLALMTVAILVVASATTAVRAQVYYINNGYHAQVTSYFCGAASMEMMLDTPTTTTFGSPNYNQNVVDLLGLSANDGGTVPNNPFPNTPNFGGQASIYSLVHGGKFAAQSGFAGGLNIYNNPGYGPGTDPIAFVNGLNAIDNSANGNNAAVSTALGNAGNNGNHSYAYYNFTPTALGGLAASNTIASAIIAYNVPASASINFGGHWIDVNGVSLNSGFITGFYVRDPWTGYALTQNQANKGLGKNTWLRYGYDVRANNSTRNGAWFNYFTPATNNANAGTGVGYSIEVEPQGPEPIDSSSAFSVPMTPEGAEINATAADSDSTTDLGDTANLGTEDGFADGHEDSNLSDDMLLQMPGDDSTEGDWLVPYDDASGVSGFTLVDADTGAIDQATWFDPGDEMTLPQVDAMVESEAAGNADPSDNFVPEPTSLAILGFGIAAAATRRRRPA